MEAYALSDGGCSFESQLVARSRAQGSLRLAEKKKAAEATEQQRKQLEQADRVRINEQRSKVAEQKRDQEEEDRIRIDTERNSASKGKKNSTLNAAKSTTVPIPASSKRSLAADGNQMGSGMELAFPSTSGYNQPASPASTDSFEQLDYFG